jgi:hypothetical protein
MRLTDLASRFNIELPHKLDTNYALNLFGVKIITKDFYSLAEYEIVNQSKHGIEFYAIDEHGNYTESLY